MGSTAPFLVGDRAPPASSGGGVKFTATSDLTTPATPTAGDVWFDLVNNIMYRYISDGVLSVWAELGPQGIPDMADLFKMLSADDTGIDSLNAQPWFPTAGGITVPASTLYRVMGFLHSTRAAGAVSHTTSFLLGGTATFTSVKGFVLTNTGDVATTLAAGMTLIDVATALAVKAASTSTTEVILMWISVLLRVNAGGTIIPQFKYSAAPGGAPTIKANSYWYMTPVGTNNVTTQGTWA